MLVNEKTYYSFGFNGILNFSLRSCSHTTRRAKDSRASTSFTMKYAITCAKISLKSTPRRNRFEGRNFAYPEALISPLRMRAFLPHPRKESTERLQTQLRFGILQNWRANILFLEHIRLLLGKSWPPGAALVKRRATQLPPRGCRGRERAAAPSCSLVPSSQR